MSDDDWAGGGDTDESGSDGDILDGSDGEMDRIQTRREQRRARARQRDCRELDGEDEDDGEEEEGEDEDAPAPLQWPKEFKRVADPSGSESMPPPRGRIGAAAAARSDDDAFLDSFLERSDPSAAPPPKRPRTAPQQQQPGAAGGVAAILRAAGLGGGAPAPAAPAAQWWDEVGGPAAAAAAAAAPWAPAGAPDAEGQREAQRLKGQGDTALAQKEFRKAVELYDRALELAPADAALLCKSSEARLSAGQRKEALRDAARAVLAQPAAWEGHMRKALVLRASKAKAAAEGCLKHAETLAAESAEGRRALDAARRVVAQPLKRNDPVEAWYRVHLCEESGKGVKALEQGEYYRAVEHFSNALRVDPSSAALLCNRAAANCRWGRPAAVADALRDAEECIRVYPGHANGYQRKAQALKAQGRAEEAAEALEAGVARCDPGGRGKLANELAQLRTQRQEAQQRQQRALHDLVR